MLTELCVTELEDTANDTSSYQSVPQPVTQESPHPYVNDMSTSGVIKIPGIVRI